MQLSLVDGILFNELQDPVAILWPPGAEGNGNQMFGSHNPCRNALEWRRNTICDRFFLQIISRWQKLHRPTADGNVFVFDHPAAAFKIIIDWSQGEQQRTRCVRKHYEDIQMQRRSGLQIEGRTDRSANGVLADNAFGLHLVDRLERSFHWRCPSSIVN